MGGLDFAELAGDLNVEGLGAEFAAGRKQDRQIGSGGVGDGLQGEENGCKQSDSFVKTGWSVHVTSLIFTHEICI